MAMPVCEAKSPLTEEPLLRIHHACGVEVQWCAVADVQRKVTVIATRNGLIYTIQKAHDAVRQRLLSSWLAAKAAELPHKREQA